MSEIINMNESIPIKSEPLVSMGEQVLRVVVDGGQGRLVDRYIGVNDPSAVASLTDEIAGKTSKDRGSVEQAIAEAITRARSGWLKQRETSASASSVYQPNFISSAELAKRDKPPAWLIKKILVKGQPAIYGGPKKALKTSTVIDAALSLGSGKPFLGKFDVPKKVQVAVLTGESGEWGVRDTAQRVAQAKGVLLPDCTVTWGFELPRLSFETDLLALRTALQAGQVEVVFIDPAYLCLMSGNPDLRVNNVFSVGPLLLSVSRLCQGIGATLVLVHHASKGAEFNRAQSGEPMELEDLSQAGFAEFARQWLLVNRRAKFEPGSGKHRLWLNVGGSTGQSGLWGVDIDEGKLGDDFGGRMWDVRVLGVDEARRQALIVREEQKAESRQTKEADQLRAVEEALAAYPEGESVTVISKAAGLSRGVGPLLAKLVENGLAVATTVAKDAGRSRREYPGFRLTTDAERREARMAPTPWLDDRLPKRKYGLNRDQDDDEVYGLLPAKVPAEKGPVTPGGDGEGSTGQGGAPGMVAG